MDNKLKKIIAKEGLILLAFIILSCLFIFGIVNIPDTGEVVRVIVWYVILLGYPAYLLIRFIFWAIKTLRK